MAKPAPAKTKTTPAAKAPTTKQAPTAGATKQGGKLCITTKAYAKKVQSQEEEEENSQQEESTPTTGKRQRDTSSESPKAKKKKDAPGLAEQFNFPSTWSTMTGMMTVEET